MSMKPIIEIFGFEKRAIDINSTQISDSQRETIGQVRDFNIDKIYFNQDGNNSYPAVFIKKVALFDESTLKQIADIHKKMWNYKKVSFLYVFSETEIRIYNCIEKPILITEETNYENELKDIELAASKQSDKERLEELVHVFSAIAIDSGLIWSVEEAETFRNKIKIQRRVDQYLVESLTEATKELESMKLKTELIHSLILRSLFLLYLEDRGATKGEFYGKIKKDAKTYFDILGDVNKTYLLFEKLEKHFNGNVFSVGKDEIGKIKEEHLNIIRKCFISGYDNTLQINLFAEMRIFNFSIISIELLSQIYESFLAKSASDKKKKTGAFYTPPSLVELILNEKLPINAKEKQYQLKILDPACGSGIFLVESFRRLVKRYENCHGQKLTDFNVLKKLLTDNIYGIEYDSSAIKVAAFSLYLALVDCLEPKTLWQGNKLPNLINNPSDKALKEQGKNLYRRDAIKELKELKGLVFDLVVGNPPFGTDALLDSIRNYCDRYKFAKEMVLPFLHKAVEFTPDGEIALIFNTKVLTNTGTTYQNFRKWLMQECYVEKVYNFSILRKAPENFGGHLFGDAVGPISIIFYKKNWPSKPNPKIVYYAPKTYVKSNILEGIVIDHTDMKCLPREECQKPDTKIWKIAMWGGVVDFELIKKIYSKYKTLEDVFDNKSNKWKRLMGLNADSKHLDFIPTTIINTKKIGRYYTPNPACYTNEDKYYRKIDDQCFVPPFIVIKQAQAQKEIAASYIDYKAYCLSSAYAINAKHISAIQKKVLVAIINSTFSKYFLFMFASSWGIERERVHGEELWSLPYLLDDIDSDISKKIGSLIDRLISIKKGNIDDDAVKIEKDIDELLFNTVLKLSESEKFHIKDTLKYSLDLFEKQQKSEAMFPVICKDTELYSEMLCSRLNEFLGDQGVFANATIYDVNVYSPLCLIKISLENRKKQLVISEENVNNEFKKISQEVWQKEATNIYFRKKVNYYSGDDIFIIRPNQCRFWNRSIAIEDALELIIENLNSEA